MQKAAAKQIPKWKPNQSINFGLFQPSETPGKFCCRKLAGCFHFLPQNRRKIFKPLEITVNNEQFSYSAKWSTKLIWLALKLFNVGWGTDEKKVISVIAHRDAAQRQQSQQTYEELYKEKLSKRLESELTGQFEKAVYRWMFSPLEREAIFAKIALTKGLDYRVIIKTSCINSSNHLLAVKQTYQNHYKHSLEEDVASDSSSLAS